MFNCGGIVNDDFVVNLLLNLTVKEFENWLTFGEIMGKIILIGFCLTV